MPFITGVAFLTGEMNDLYLCSVLSNIKQSHRTPIYLLFFILFGNYVFQVFTGSTGVGKNFLLTFCPTLLHNVVTRAHFKPYSVFLVSHHDLKKDKL